MPGVNKFAKLTSVDDAIKILNDICKPVERISLIDLEYADNRIIARDVAAPRNYPHYDLSLMDGFGVRAEDTIGAREDAGKFLKLINEGAVSQGTCMLVHTGGALPAGANCVVRREDTVAEKDGMVILVEAKAGDNFVPEGNSLKKDDIVYREGAQLKPTDIGTLGRLGLTRVEVYDKPRVLIIPTGDELIERGKEPGPGVINDGNSLICQLTVKRYGGKPAIHDIVRDNLEALTDALKEGTRYDLIITTGGTSVGFRDRMDEAIASTGKVLVHGIALKPGRPMGIGYIEQEGKRTPIMFLPGVMEACAASMFTFAGVALRKLGRYPEPHDYKGKAILTRGVRKFPNTLALTKLLIEGNRASPVNIVGDPYRRGEYAYLVAPENSGSYEEGDEVETVYLE